MTLGEDAVFAEIHKARPHVVCTTPVTAALAAFRALGSRKIGLLTPYSPEINSDSANFATQAPSQIALPACLKNGAPFLPDQLAVAADDDYTGSFQNIQCYDAIKVQAILNEIDGKTHNRQL